MSMSMGTFGLVGLSKSSTYAQDKKAMADRAEMLKKRAKEKEYAKAEQSRLRAERQAKYQDSIKIGDLSSYEDQTGYDEIGYQAGENEAVRGVEQEFSGMAQRETRELGRMGISPTSGRAGSTRQRRAMNLALARSGARLEARNNVDTQNLARETASRDQAMNLRSQDITQRGQTISANTANNSPSNFRVLTTNRRG